MRKGTLIRDAKTDRMVIRYGIKEYSSGLHCGTPLEVKLGVIGGRPGLSMMVQIGIWMQSGRNS